MELANAPPFLVRLHGIVSDKSTDAVVCWASDKEYHSFVIKDQKQFCDDILPKFYRAKKYESFTRSLNQYGFVNTNKRILTSQTFYHPLFEKGRQHQLAQISKKVHLRKKRVCKKPPKILGKRDCFPTRGHEAT